MKRFSIIVLILSLFMGLVSSCSKSDGAVEPPVEEHLRFANGVVPVPVFDFSGGVEHLIFEAPHSWSVRCDDAAAQQWCHLHPMSGDEGLADLKLRVDDFKGETSRRATFRLVCGEEQFRITVTQTQDDALIVGKNRYDMEAEGGEIQLAVKHNVPLQVSVNVGWIEQVESRSYEETLLKFKVLPLREDSSRQGVITISDTENKLSEEIVVVQTNEVEIEDAAFKSYLLEHFDANHDGLIARAELEAITEMDCSVKEGGEILSLKGIELMPNLSRLRCRGHKIQELDLSFNPLLEEVDCSENQLKALDVSGLEGLTALDCSSNEVTELDLNKNLRLRKLRCATNQLRALELGANTELDTLVCTKNQLDTLVVLPLKKLQVLDFMANNLLGIDVSENFELRDFRCSHNNLQSLDISRNDKIRKLYAYNNPDLTLVYVWQGFSLIRLEDVEVDVRIDFVSI